MLSGNHLEQKHDINSTKSRFLANVMKRNNESEYYPHNCDSSECLEGRSHKK